MKRLLLTVLVLCGLAGIAKAQQRPYLLLQGPTTKKAYRFMVGELLTLRLQGEEEFFEARINELYPESQTFRVDDMILSMGNVAEVRHRKNSAGFKTFLQLQGATNLTLIGGFSAFQSEDRDRQKNFLIGAAIVNVVMVAVGSFGKNAQREVAPHSRYLLKVGGGDLRDGDGEAINTP